MKINNQSISYEDINKLNKDERDYLRKQAKSELLEKFKTLGRSDINAFDKAKVEFAFGDTDKAGKTDGNLTDSEITKFFNETLNLKLPGVKHYSAKKEVSFDMSKKGKSGQSPAERKPVIDNLLKGKHIYSQNFGSLDRDHINHNFDAYRKVFAALEKANKTGKEQEVKLTFGGGLGGAKELNITFKVKPTKSKTEMHRISREIVANISYRYEHSTQLFQGAANKVFEKVGMGSSSFSTEDLPSNGLGMMAAEHFIKKYGNGNGESTDKDNKKAIDYVIDKAGKIFNEPPADDVKMKSFGNKTFVPKLSKSLKAEKGAGAYLKKLDAERVKNGNMPSKGKGWEITKNDGGLQGALEKLTGIPRIIH